MTLGQIRKGFDYTILKKIDRSTLNRMVDSDFPNIYAVDVAVDNDKLISFFNSEEHYNSYYAINDTDIRREYRRKHGIMTRCGRVMRRFGITDNQEQAVLVGKIMPMQIDIREVYGEDIRKWYHGDNYDSDSLTASLGGSCMRYSSCQPYFDVYVENARMVIATNKVNDRLVGRAILWPEAYFDELGETCVLMDRIYGNDAIVEKFKEYAKEHGYIHKRRQSYSDKSGFIKPDGQEFSSTVTVDIPDVHSKYTSYPYIDTMSYGGPKGLCNRGIRSYTYEFESTEGDGGESSDDYYTCSYCEDRVYHADATNIDGSYYCESCLSEHYVYSEYSNEYVYVDDAICVDDTIYNMHNLPNFIVCCDVCGEYFDNSISENDDVCDDCYVEPEDEEDE